MLFCLILAIFQYTPMKKTVLAVYPVICIAIIVGSAIYLGTRTYEVGIDTVTYKASFNALRSYGLSSREKLTDILFYFLTWIFAIFDTWPLYLTFCGLVYLGGAYLGMKGLFGKMALFSLLVFVISPNFFQFSINVMRNGFAASVFIMSFMWKEQPRKMYITMACSILCHVSMIFPFLLFILFRKAQSIQFPVLILCLSVMMKLIGLSVGSVFSVFLPSDLAASYLTGVMDDESQSWGSLILYGLSPVFTAIYFVGMKKYRDPFYVRLLSMYCIGMAIYVQIIDVPFALRFAYLSTFLMPILLIYPMLKKTYWKFQNFWITAILLIIFAIKAQPIISQNL